MILFNMHWFIIIFLKEINFIFRMEKLSLIYTPCKDMNEAKNIAKAVISLLILARPAVPNAAVQTLD